MQNQLFIPYTYLIGWSSHNIWYYGSEYKNNRTKVANPVNLWTNYFTSSKRVAQLRLEWGEPDVVEVRKTFAEAQEAVNWETRVLKRLKVVHKSHWLNQQCGDGKFRRSQTPRVLSEETRAKLRMPRKKRTPEQCAYASAIRMGKKRPQAVIDKQQQTRKARGYHTKEYMESVGMTRKGTTHEVSKTTRQKISESRSKRTA